MEDMSERPREELKDAKGSGAIADVEPFDEMPYVTPDVATGAGPRTGRVPHDLREWIAGAEALGEFLRVDQEVETDQEMSAITYMLANSMSPAPVLLFERPKGYTDGVRSLWNSLGSSLDRIAMSLGFEAGMSRIELVRGAREAWKDPVRPRWVSPDEAPVFHHHALGDDVDLLSLPAPVHWPKDGGAYIGTCDMVITKDPDTGNLNAGTYRMMVHDDKHVGLFQSPGKDARLHIERSWQLGQPAEVVACWGINPTWLTVTSQGFPKSESELDYIGSVMGAPLEVVDGMVTGLPVPSRAEIAVEGTIAPGAVKLEGPFGEFQGYYGAPEADAFLVKVEAVHRRSDPIFTNALMADYPANEASLLFAVARSARIWSDLDRLGVPGIKGVWCHPAAAGGLGMISVSLEQRYAGHASQVLALAAQCPGGAYFSKWIVAVDEDVDPSDINQVLWAMSTRCNPVNDIDILRDTWSTWLDPTQNPPDKRPYGSKSLVNACREHRYLPVFSPRSKVARSVYERISRRWADFGLPGDPPALWALEEDK